MKGPGARTARDPADALRPNAGRSPKADRAKPVATGQPRSLSAPVAAAAGNRAEQPGPRVVDPLDDRAGQRRAAQCRPRQAWNTFRENLAAHRPAGLGDPARVIPRARFVARAARTQADHPHALARSHRTEATRPDSTHRAARSRSAHRRPGRDARPVSQRGARLPARLRDPPPRSATPNRCSRHRWVALTGFESDVPARLLWVAAVA